MKAFREFLQLQQLTELVHLSDFLNKKGNDFLGNLLNKKVAVNLKIDTSAIVVGKINGEIKYWGREGKTEITNFRRQGADLYEKSIKHLESRDLNKIPDGVQIFMEFFDARLPTIVTYTQHPKNNLIISYIKKNGKIIAPDNPLNEKMAKLLDIAPPPVLFSGKLNKKQKQQLIDYAETPPEEIAQKYGGKNFVKFVLSLFVPPSKMKFLMTDTLEGMVFYFGEGDKIDMAKVNDPSFTQGIKDKQNKNDIYHTSIMKIIYDNLTKHANKVGYKTSNYNDFIYSLTQQYVKSGKLKALDKYKYNVTDQRFARLTFNLLPGKVKKMVDKQWSAEDVYRILHFMFEKSKKRTNPRTGLTKDRKEQINNIVDNTKHMGRN